MKEEKSKENKKACCYLDKSSLHIVLVLAGLMLGTVLFLVGVSVGKNMVQKEAEIMVSRTVAQEASEPNNPNPGICKGDCYPDYIPWECPWNPSVDEVKYSWSNKDNRYIKSNDSDNTVISLNHIASPEGYNGRNCVQYVLSSGYELESMAISALVSRDPMHGGSYYACFPLRLEDIRTANIACYYDIFPNADYYPKDDPMTNIVDVILNTSYEPTPTPTPVCVGKKCFVQETPVPSSKPIPTSPPRF